MRMMTWLYVLILLLPIATVTTAWLCGNEESFNKHTTHRAAILDVPETFMADARMSARQECMCCWLIHADDTTRLIEQGAYG